VNIRAARVDIEKGTYKDERSLFRRRLESRARAARPAGGACQAYSFRQRLKRGREPPGLPAGRARPTRSIGDEKSRARACKAYVGGGLCTLDGITGQQSLVAGLHHGPAFKHCSAGWTTNHTCQAFWGEVNDQIIMCPPDYQMFGTTCADNFQAGQGWLLLLCHNLYPVRTGAAVHQEGSP